MGFGFGKRSESSGNSTADMANSQRTRANDNFTTGLELRRAFAVFKCCASHGTYVDLNDVDTGWHHLREEGRISTGLDAAWKELDGILLTSARSSATCRLPRIRRR